jgi:outer membrane protein
MRPSFLVAAVLAWGGPLRAAADGPITLDEALAQAASQSHDLKLARADADLVGADALGAWSGFLPRLDLNTAVGHEYIGPGSQEQAVVIIDPTTHLPVVDPVTGQIGYRTALVATPAIDFGAHAFDLTLSQPLFDGLASFRMVEQARASVRAAGRTFDEQRLSVAFEVTRLFYELVKAERSLSVQEGAARRSEELVGRADALYAAGRAPKSDTLAARVNLGNDRIAAEQASTRVVQARADLAVALGRRDDAGLEVVPPAFLEAPGLPSAEVAPLEALLDRARANRPSLAAARAQVEAADASLGVARGAYWPSVSARLDYGRQGTTLVGTDGVWGNPARQFTATGQVVLTWNLFSGRTTDAAVARAAVSAERARISSSKTEAGVAREVTDARQGVRSLAAQLALSAENLSTAREALSLARQRLEAGLASQLEVRDAALKLTQAELSLVQARIDHAVAVADLTRAVGGTL